MNEETKLYYIPYEVLREQEDIPKSFFGFWSWLIRSIVKGLSKGFPKNLLAPLIIGLIYISLNLLYMSMINDTLYINSDNSIIAYIFSGIVLSNNAIKGFDLFENNIESVYWTIPMLFILTSLVLNIFKRIQRNGFKAFIHDISRAKTVARLYAQASTKDIISYILLGCFGSAIIGFVIQSPVIPVLLSITLFLSFTLKEKGKIIGLITMYLIAINLNRKKPKYVNIANIALGVLGFSIGFAIYFSVALVIWFIFNYNIFARIIFTAMMVVGSYLLYKNRAHELKSSTTSLLLFLFGFITIIIMSTTKVYADDGGWTESGRSITGWLSNPGTKLLALLGLKGSSGALFGWLADTGLSGVLPALGLDVALKAGQLICGAGSPAELGFTALETALSPLGPLGTSVSNAWRTSIDALAGKGNSSTGGNSSSGNSSSGSGGSKGGKPNARDFEIFKDKDN